MTRIGFSRIEVRALFAALLFLIWADTAPAYADCVNPAATEGRLIYNSTHKIAQFCDGTNWISMSGTGGGGITSAGNDSEVIFNDGGTLTGDSVFVFDNTNKRLGIGTATPTQKLDVAGVMTSDGLLLKAVAGDPPANAGSATLAGLTDVDVSAVADGKVLTYVNATSKWEAAAPSSGADNLGNHIVTQNLRLGAYWLSGDGGNEGIAVDANGNVGIGTTVPTTFGGASGLDGTDLQVASAAGNARAAISGATTAALHMIRTGNSANKKNYVFEVNSGNLMLSQYADGYGSSLPLMTWLDTGNVGIGTTGPGAKLEVSGTNTPLVVFKNTNSGAYSEVEIRNDSTAHFNVGSRGSAAGAYGALVANNAYLYSAQDVTVMSDGGIIKFATGGNSEKMRIDSNGNVAMRTTTNNYGETLSISTAGAQGIHIDDSTGSASINFIYFTYGGTSGARGGIYYSPGSGLVVSSSSDRRLKENITPTAIGLETLLKIQVEDFNFISDPGKTRVQGFIAQDLYKVYPQAVKVGGDDPQKNPWMVSDGRLTPVIIKAVQDLKADNDNLRGELKAANDNIAELRAEIHEVKAALH